jgi:hypothetical protein
VKSWVRLCNLISFLKYTRCNPWQFPNEIPKLHMCEWNAFKRIEARRFVNALYQVHSCIGCFTTH